MKTADAISQADVQARGCVGGVTSPSPYFGASWPHARYAALGTDVLPLAELRIGGTKDAL
jgi:hypothetical protein